MFALSLVVIAGLIGGRGLGDVVTNGLYSNAALALLAGAAIVIMAIALDRSTAAIAERTDPTRRHLTDEGRRRARLITLGVFGAIVAIVLLARALGAAPVYPASSRPPPRSTRRRSSDQLLSWIQSALDYVQDPDSFIFGITEPIGNFLVKYALEPLRVALTEMPWFVTIAGLSLIALITAGVRPAITVAAMLLAIGVMGVWDPAMDTASQVLVATAIAVAIGIAVGVWAAESAARREAAAPAARHAPDAPAARLHHPVHLLDAGVAGARCRRLRPVRGAGRDPARDGGGAHRPARGRGGGRGIRGEPAAGAAEGEASRSRATRSCSASTRGSSWSSPSW